MLLLMFTHPCQERRAALCRAIVGPNLQIAAHSLVVGDAADLHPDAVSNLQALAASELLEAADGAALASGCGPGSDTWDFGPRLTPRLHLVLISFE